MILHLVCCLYSFYPLICDQFDYWFSHLGISMFVYGFIFVRNRLRIPPCFLLLQNLRASAHYYLYLNECCVFQLILDKFLPSQLWSSSPPALFLYRWRDMSQILLPLSDRKLPLLSLLFFCRIMHFYETYSL